MLDGEFYQLSYGVNNFLKFSLGINTSLSKMSLQGTIVPGRLRSELCSLGVN